MIYVSAKADVQSRVHGLRLGAEDYLVKPYDILELLVRMEKVLARADKQPKQLTYGDVAVDLESRSVTKGNETISLKKHGIRIIAWTGLLLRDGGLISASKVHATGLFCPLFV